MKLQIVTIKGKEQDRRKNKKRNPETYCESAQLIV